MASYQEPAGKSTPEWPYPVNYGKENEVSADVLILGGGIAGCHAAINDAKRGARVMVVEKGAVYRSGSGGAGVDHWHNAYTNPCSKITPEEVTELRDRLGTRMPEGYGSGHVRHIEAKESWDALHDMEEMGVPIRDVDDEFKGAEFRDEETRLMFAYDYQNKHVVRVRGGANIKTALYHELNRLGVAIHDRSSIVKCFGGNWGKYYEIFMPRVLTRLQIMVYYMVHNYVLNIVVYYVWRGEMASIILSDDVINSTDLRDHQAQWFKKALIRPVSITSGAKKLVLLNREHAKHMYSLSHYAEMIIQFCRERGAGKKRESDVFPWVKHLSEQAIEEFHNELFSIFEEVMHNRDWLAFEEMLNSWVATAEAMTNPEMVDLITTDLSKEEFTRVE